jgi:hypothetical protein
MAAAAAPREYANAEEEAGDGFSEPSINSKHSGIARTSPEAGKASKDKMFMITVDSLSNY